MAVPTSPPPGLAQQRIQPVDPCSLLSRGEVEVILGGTLIADPVGHGTESCTYQLKPVGIRQLYELQLTWRGGYTRWREDGFISQLAAGTMARMSTDGGGPGAGKVVLDTLGTHAEVTGPSWERGEQRGVEFTAIK